MYMFGQRACPHVLVCLLACIVHTLLPSPIACGGELGAACELPGRYISVHARGPLPAYGCMYYATRGAEDSER